MAVIDKNPLTVELEKRCARNEDHTEHVNGTRISTMTMDAPVTIAGNSVELWGDRLLVTDPNGEEIPVNSDGNIIIEETGKHWRGKELTLVMKDSHDGEIEFVRNCNDPNVTL
jgi:hypothetical protein